MLVARNHPWSPRLKPTWLPLPVSAALFLTCQLLASAQEPQTAPPQRPPAAAATPNPNRQRDVGQAFFGLAAKPDAEAVARGQNLFVATCGFCHGSNALGGNSGPNLVRSVLVLHDEGSGKEIGPVILNGRPDKGMPKFALSEPQIKDIAAFLLSRSQAAVVRMDYKTLNLVTGNADAGKQFFTAHCANCHSANGDLAHIASKFEPEQLQSRFLYPGTRRRQRAAATAPVSSKSIETVTVTPRNGPAVDGTLTYLDDFNVVLTDKDGESRSWSRDDPGLRVQVHDPLQGHSDLLPQYTDADMHNLLSYLVTLK